MFIRKLASILVLLTALNAATAPTIGADDVEVRTAHIVPEGVVTWGERSDRATTHWLGDTGRFLHRHHKLITTGVVVASACAITWIATTMTCKEEHRAETLSSECLGALKEGAIYLTHDLNLRLDETGDAVFQYLCGFAKTDAGNILCCDLKGEPVAPDSPWPMSINILGNVWNCYAAAGDSWKRFLGYEL